MGAHLYFIVQVRQGKKWLTIKATKKGYEVVKDADLPTPAPLLETPEYPDDDEEEDAEDGPEDSDENSDEDDGEEARLEEANEAIAVANGKLMKPFIHSGDYNDILFAKVAGVRNEYGLTKIYPRKGWPADVSARAINQMFIAWIGNESYAETYLVMEEIRGLDRTELPFKMKIYLVLASDYTAEEKPAAPKNMVYSNVYTEADWLALPKKERKRLIEASKNPFDKTETSHIGIIVTEKKIWGGLWGLDKFQADAEKFQAAFPDQELRFIITFNG